MAFEPKNQNPKLQLFSQDLRAGLSWRLFIFFLVAFSIAVLSYLGLQYGYKTFLNNSIEEYDAVLEEARTRIGVSEQENLIGFYSQIVNLKSLFRSHILGSKLFAFLEANTSTRVAYSSASLGVPERQLVLDGVTDSYETLVGQLMAFENAKGVESILLGNNSSDAGVVKFNLRLVFKPDFFLPQ